VRPAPMLAVAVQSLSKIEKLFGKGAGLALASAIGSHAIRLGDAASMVSAAVRCVAVDIADLALEI
jgi:hypothetical protein